MPSRAPFKAQNSRKSNLQIGTVPGEQTKFITLLGGAAAWPLVARAQQSERMPRIGIRRVGLLMSSGAASYRGWLVRALESSGYREGQNLALEVRSADGRLDRLPALAKELVGVGVELIVAVNSPGTKAAIATGTQIPIVMALVGDPVGTGFVQNLSRPGGTVTGVTNASGDLAPKRLGLLKEAIPAARRIAVFTHPDDPVAAVQIRQVEAAAGRKKRSSSLERTENTRVKDVSNLSARSRIVLRKLAISVDKLKS